jgi:uncharacterized protein
MYLEIADSPSTREKGLMGVKELPKDQGMIFVFPRKQRQSFWMSNTYIPLDIAFIDDTGKIMQIEQMYPMNTKLTTSTNRCLYAVEMNEGWFGSNGIDVGYQLFSGDDWVKDLKKSASFENKSLKRIAQVNLEDAIDFEPNILQGEIPEEFQGDLSEQEQQKEEQQSEQEQQPQINPNIVINLNVRQKIEHANTVKIPMEVLYWTINGYVLPPRKIIPLEMDGYLVKSGPNGDYLVAYDSSPSIYGSGWEIKGGTPKNFLIDNIIKLDLIEPKEGIQNINQELVNEPKNFWDRLKGFFTK